MIQNVLTFVVKGDFRFVEGSLPVGKLTATSINRNSIYLVAPFSIDNVITVNFRDARQEYNVIPVKMKAISMSVDELIDSNRSYYPLVKDWNVWECKIPMKALLFISQFRGGHVGISFNAFSKDVSKAPEGFEDGGDIIDNDFNYFANNKFYVVKLAQFTFEGMEFGYNDIAYREDGEIKKVKAVVFDDKTITVKYGVDPAIPFDTFEDVDMDLLEEVLLANENTLSQLYFVLRQMELLDRDFSEARPPIYYYEGD